MAVRGEGSPRRGLVEVTQSSELGYCDPRYMLGNNASGVTLAPYAAARITPHRSLGGDSGGDTR